MFSDVALYNIYKEVKNVDTTRASEDNDISAKIIRENFDIFSSLIFQSLHQSHDVSVSIFPKALQWKNIVPVFKKG